MDKITFVMACKEFFGVKPGQSLAQFAGELRDIPPADKAELAALLTPILGKEVTLAPPAPVVATA